ncbi:hypothetical protein K1X76_05955 [bacterium]|nr:hypothetical protein [bacterium]
MNLDLIRSNLESQDEAVQHKAWFDLYYAQTPEAFQEITRILIATDPILKILFCRFLSRLEDERSSRYLVTLLNDLNESVVERAILAYDKNRYPEKIKRLLNILKAPHPKARLYAIDKLTSHAVSESTVPILRIMREQDEKTFMACLMGIRLLADKRIFNDAAYFLNSNDENVRFHALLALGSIYHYMKRQILKLILLQIKDPSPRIRKAILWIIKRDRKHKVRNLFFELSMGDLSADVRQEAISCLAVHPNFKVVRHLVDILTRSNDRNVVLKAEATLLGFPMSMLSRYLKKMMSDKNSVIRFRVLTLYASLKKDDDCFHYLMQEWRGKKDDKETIHLMECMGYQGDKRYIPLLEDGLSKSQVNAYVASGVLCKIWGNNKNMPLLFYLEKTIKYESTIQVFLKHACKMGFEADENLKDFLIPLMNHPVANIRYLVLQLLKLKVDPSLFLSLTILEEKEQDPAIKQVLDDIIHDIVSQDPIKAAETLMTVTDVVFAERLLSLLVIQKLSPIVLFNFSKTLMCLDQEGRFTKILFDWLAVCLKLNLFALNDFIEHLDNRQLMAEALQQMQRRIYDGDLLYFDLSQNIIRKLSELSDAKNVEILILSLGCGYKAETLSELISFLCDSHYVSFNSICTKAIRFFMSRTERQVA